MLKRMLQALYHPHNQYVVQLDAESPPEERLDLQNYVSNHEVFMKFRNVRMITKADLVTHRGPTMVANKLHAAAILLKEGGDWDWFINLSASDYPLVTQGDLLHTFSYLPQDLNFIDHTSNIGWKRGNNGRNNHGEGFVSGEGLRKHRSSASTAPNRPPYCPSVYPLLPLVDPLTAPSRPPGRLPTTPSRSPNRIPLLTLIDPYYP
ncbi:hypothetical protein ACLB2K_027566 [Fragaria x ananassa]